MSVALLESHKPTLNRRSRRALNRDLGEPRGRPLQISEWKTIIIAEWEENGVKHNSHQHTFTITSAGEAAHQHTQATFAEQPGVNCIGTHTHSLTVNAGSNHTHVCSGTTSITAAADLNHTHNISITSQAGTAHTHVFPTPWPLDGCAQCVGNEHTHVAGGINGSESAHNHGLSGATGIGVGLLRWHNHTVNLVTDAGSAHTHGQGTGTIGNTSCNEGYVHNHTGTIDTSSSESVHIHNVVGSTDFEGEPIDGSNDLFVKFVVRHSSSQELFAKLIIRHSDSAELFGEFVIKHPDSQDLFADFHVGQDARDLFSKFEIQHEASQDLFTKFVVRHSASQNLFAKFVARQEAFQDLFAKFITKHDGAPQDLFAKLIVRHSDSTTLFAKFVVRHSGSAEFFAEFIVRQSASQSIFAKFVVRQTGSANFKGTFTVRQPSEDLLATFIVRHTSLWPAELKATFTVVQLSANLRAVFTVRNTGSQNLFSEFVVRNTGTPQNLLATFHVGQNTRNLFAKFRPRHTYDVFDVIVDDNIASWINFTVGTGDAFIALPVIVNDAAEKRVGINSVRLTSAYAEHEYDAIHFGWVSTGVSYDFSSSTGFGFYWWGSDVWDGDQMIELLILTGSGGGYWVRFPDSEAAWKWVFFTWGEFQRFGIADPDMSDVIAIIWSYFSAGVRRLDYIVAWNQPELFAKFMLRTGATTPIFGKFVVRQAAIQDLLATINVRNVGSADLHCKFYVGYEVFEYPELASSDSECQQAPEAETALLASSDSECQAAPDITAITTFSDYLFFFGPPGENLFCKFEIQASQDLFAEFVVNHP